MNKTIMLLVVLLVCVYQATAQLSPTGGAFLAGLSLPFIINGGQFPSFGTFPAGIPPPPFYYPGGFCEYTLYKMS